MTIRVYLSADNLSKLEGVDFVFLCVDKGTVKRLAVEKLEELGTSFIDVGMGVDLNGESLQGLLRITTSPADKRQGLRVKQRIPFQDGGDDNAYSRNIQVADLNALNAALAVIKWKKLYGFYLDLENEHNCTYVISGNEVINEDQL